MELRAARKRANRAGSEQSKCINIREHPQQPVGNDEHNVRDMMTTRSGVEHNSWSETSTMECTAPGIKQRLRGVSRNEDAAENLEQGRKPQN